METLDYILDKYGVRQEPSPIRLAIGRGGLARLFAELGFRSGAEIGVERGYYSEVLCQANSELRLLCVDAWQTYPGYRDHVNQAKMEGYYREAVRRLAKYHCTIVRDWSLKAAQNVPNGSLDFVYIDANHEFRAVTDDIAEWGRKVRPGGIVAGHDYVRVRRRVECHVKQVVDCWTYAHRIRPWFIVTHTDGELLPGDRFPSWFWVQR